MLIMMLLLLSFVTSSPNFAFVTLTINIYVRTLRYLAGPSLLWPHVWLIRYTPLWISHMLPLKSIGPTHMTSENYGSNEIVWSKCSW
jgi:hypothetical protein